MKGTFVLSNMDCPAVRAAFAGCTFTTTDNTFTVAGKGHGKAVHEVIITGPRQR